MSQDSKKYYSIIWLKEQLIYSTINIQHCLPKKEEKEKK